MLRPIPGWLMAMAITLTAMAMPDTEDTMATPTLTTARGLLMLSPLPMPRPIPGWLMAMAITLTAMAMPDTEDTMATPTLTMATTPTPADMPTADADPKADPWLTYGYYGHYPYTYGYAHHGYYGYPYSYGYWGKK